MINIHFSSIQDKYKLHEGAFDHFAVFPGLIHLMGFIHAFQFAVIKQFSLEISRMAGMIWLLVAVLIFVSAILFIANFPGRWFLLSGAILISQILILKFWKDAKAGTLVNLIILLLAIIGFSTDAFSWM